MKTTKKELKTALELAIKWWNEDAINCDFCEVCPLDGNCDSQEQNLQVKVEAKQCKKKLFNHFLCEAKIKKRKPNETT